MAALCGSQHGASVHTVVVIGCVQHYGANTVVLHAQVDAEDECHYSKHQILLYCIGPKWTRCIISVIPGFIHKESLKGYSVVLFLMS